MKPQRPPFDQTPEPRYNLVEKPITKSRAIELWTNRVRAAEEEISAAMAAPLAEFEMGFEEVTDPAQGASFEYVAVKHPEILRLSSVAGRDCGELSDALKTKIQIEPTP